MKTINLSRFNIDIYLKIFLLLGFAFFFIVTILTGTVNLYVHPRIIPFMIFASVSMLIIAVLLIGELTKARNLKTNIGPLLFFVIPLLMAYTISPQSFDSNTRTVAEIQLASDKSMDVNKDTSQESRQEDNSEENSADTGYSGITYQDMNNGLHIKNGVISMEGDNFSYCMNEIYCNIDTYEGMPI